MKEINLERGLKSDTTLLWLRNLCVREISKWGQFDFDDTMQN